MKNRTARLAIQFLSVLMFWFVSSSLSAAQEIMLSIDRDDPEKSKSTITSKSERIHFSIPAYVESLQLNLIVNREYPELKLQLSTQKGAKAMAACPVGGHPTICPVDVILKDYDLEPGDSIEIEANFTEQVLKKTKVYKKTYVYQQMSIGSFRFGAGAFFVFSDEDNYFTQPVDGGQEISTAGGDSLSLNLVATTTWIPNGMSSGDGFTGGWSHGPTLGVGTDSNNLSLFLGWSGIYRRGWVLTTGVAAVKEKKLLPQYEVGQIVTDPIDSTALTKDSYEPRLFLGLSWTPASKK